MASPRQPDLPGVATPWDDALARRFEAAGFDTGVIGPFWLDPRVAPGAGGLRDAYLADLDESERTHGPPTLAEVDRHLQREADADPAMPAWIRRPWYVPGDHMLAAEAILVEACGFGYSATGSGGGGRRHLRGDADAPGLHLTVNPVPGMVPLDRNGREAVQVALTDRLRAEGVRDPRVVLLWDVDPARAFQGLYEGRKVRLGHVALGLPHEPVLFDGQP